MYSKQLGRDVTAPRDNVGCGEMAPPRTTRLMYTIQPFVDVGVTALYVVFSIEFQAVSRASGEADSSVTWYKFSDVSVDLTG